VLLVELDPKNPPPDLPELPLPRKLKFINTSLV